MDFIKILMDGYSVDLNVLDERYKRDASDSINEKNSYESFFNGCFIALETIKTHIEKQFIIEKSELEKQIADARSKNDIIAEGEHYNSLKWLTLNDTKINLSIIDSTNCTSTIRYEKLNDIESALTKARDGLIKEGRMTANQSIIKSTTLPVVIQEVDSTNESNHLNNNNTQSSSYDRSVFIDKIIFRKKDKFNLLLNEIEALNLHKVNKKTTSAIALMFFQDKFFNNTSNFNLNKKLFEKYYNQILNHYKPSNLEAKVSELKNKFRFLDEMNIRQD